MVVFGGKRCQSRAICTNHPPPVSPHNLGLSLPQILHKPGGIGEISQEWCIGAATLRGGATLADEAGIPFPYFHTGSNSTEELHVATFLVLPIRNALPCD